MFWSLNDVCRSESVNSPFVNISVLLPAPRTATAEPVEQNDAAKAVGAAESRVAALVKKAGKNGILLGIFVASLVYMIAGGTVCFEGGTLTCVGVSAYAFSAGLISMIVSAVYICLMRFTQVCAVVASRVYLVCLQCGQAA